MVYRLHSVVTVHLLVLSVKIHPDFTPTQEHTRTMGLILVMIDNGKSAEGLRVSYSAEAWTLSASLENPSGTIRTAGVNTKTISTTKLLLTTQVLKI